MNPVARVAGLLGAAAGGRLGAAGYQAGWTLVRGLPEPVALRLFQAGADLALLRGGSGLERLRTNLARVAPGEDLQRAAVRSYARYWCEVFRLPSMPHERIVSGAHTVDEQLFRASLAAPTGTILALPHAGNWDHAGAWCGLTGAPFATVAERLRPESLYESFLAFRRSLGMEVLPLTGGARPPYDVLVERLEAGGTVCLMADRDLTPRGVDVEFFGATARMPAGPARLAMQTGATLLPVTLSFPGRDWRIRFHAAVPAPVDDADVPRAVQQQADAFAAGIGEAPQDWHMLQRFWLDDLDADDPRRQRA